MDTSTGVLSPAAHIASLTQKHSPDSLIVLDAVCAVASEEIQFDEWKLDVVISATQKGLGAPPGLSVVMASGRAVEVMKTRKTPVQGYYIDWNRWLPIMKAYEEGRGAYFATRESTSHIAVPGSAGTPCFSQGGRMGEHSQSKRDLQICIRAGGVRV